MFEAKKGGEGGEFSKEHKEICAGVGVVRYEGACEL